MKKILFILLVSMVGLAAVAQNTTMSTTTTTTTHKYYYYPSYNVYWDEASGNYWYYDDAGSQWTMVQTLPSTIVIKEKTPKYHVVYNGDDPWKNNAADMKKYKVKKNGTVKAKGKD